MKQPITCPLDIVVVGAGMGGLSAAIACRLAGHNVTIYEEAPELKEVGAGIQITPNGVNILQNWGVSIDKAVEPSAYIVRRYSGELLIHERDFNKNLRERYKAPVLNFHRTDLQLGLAQRARELGAQIRLGQHVDHINTTTHDRHNNSGQAEIICKTTGVRASADLVIAADGLWSGCRSSLLPSSLSRNDQPLPTGDLAYRITLHINDITDPELRQWVLNPKLNFWIGPGAHAVGYSLRRGTMYNIVLLVPDDLPEHARKQPGSSEQMKALFEGWDPVLTRFLQLVPDRVVVEKWKLMHRKPLSHWVNKQSNVVFLGDACHPMLPYLGQGANMAIEDGAVLGHLLEGVTTRSQLQLALEVYEQLRKPRGEAVVRQGFGQRDSWHLPDGPEQEARDAVLSATLDSSSRPSPSVSSNMHMQYLPRSPSRWMCPRVQPWLFGYNAEAEVRAALIRRHFLDIDTAVSAPAHGKSKDRHIEHSVQVSVQSANGGRGGKVTSQTVKSMM